MDRACVRWVVFWMAMSFLAPAALATTYNSPTVDGVPPQANPGQIQAARDASWASDEQLVEDPVGDSAWGPNNDLHGVWVTWDANGIYFSVEGAVWDTPAGVGANAVNLYIDADYGQGTGYGDLAILDQNALNAVSRNFWRPLVIGGGFGVDWGYTSWAGRFDLGFLDVSDPDAPINLFEGVNGQTSAVNESPEGVIEARDQTNNAGYELFIPWSLLYPDAGAGRVPAGTQIALVVAQVGGGDSLSPESLPDGADDRVIERPLVFTVDGDGDGTPDQNWPPNGTIAGTVMLSDLSDTTSVVEVVAYPEGSETIVGRAETPPGGGAYSISRLQPGNYRVEVNALDFCASPQTTTVVENVDSIVDFTVDRAESGFGFSIGFADGPEATSQTSNIVLGVRRVFDDRVVADEVLPPGADTVREFRLCDGDYEIEIFAQSDADSIGTNTGYTSISFTQTVSGSSIVDLGQLLLELVQPTRLVFMDALDAANGMIEVVRIPKSERVTLGDGSIDFGASQFVRGALEVAAIDDDGNEAWLTDALRAEVTFALTSIDPRWPADGVFDYWSEADGSRLGTDDDTLDLLTLAPATKGRTRARFLLSGDTRQIARLRASHPSAGIATGNLEVAITSQLPAAIDAQFESLSIVAGDSTEVRATVLDVLGEPIRVDDQRIDFVVESGAGRARVLPNPSFTDQDGTVGGNGDVVFTSTLAGSFRVVATVDNGIETVASDTFVVDVAPAAARTLRVSPRVTGLDNVRVDVQVTDAFDNPAAIGTGRTATVSVGPDALVASAPTTVALDDDGFGSFDIMVVGDLPGVLEIRVTDTTLPVTETSVDFALSAGLAGIDEPAPESVEPNSIAGADLTTFAVSIIDDEFVFTIPFASIFGGMHLGIAIDVDASATGAPADPFAFPLTYAHEFLPDFALTYKYSANDYGDFRRWNLGSGAWEWYDWANGQYVSAFADGANVVVQERVVKSESDVVFRVPMNVLAPGFRQGVDTIRAQVYVMQEEGEKRKPFDSIPHDETLDMVIGDVVVWEAFGDDTALNGYLNGTTSGGNTTLSEYAEVSPRVIGNSLRVDSVVFSPETTTQGEDLLIHVAPVFPAGEGPANPIFQVFADLSALGGGRAVRMNDEGRSGDLTAGDGIFSVLHTVPTTQFGGAVDVVVRTLELTTAQEVFTSGTVEVIGDPELVPLVSFVDAEGDDHGPNQQGRDFLYYIQPTNGVFFDGVFDLRQLDVFDLGDRLLFRVTIGDLTDPNETSSADWGATYPSDTTCPEGQRTDLNLQNVVVLIDSQDGVNNGSTRIPSNRWADVAAQDAWDHALVYDGWWKGVVSSQGSSLAGDWNIGASDAEFYFCADASTNTIDGFVSKNVFTDDELEKILNWDLIVMISSHDGDSNEDNWGGVRWVNDDVSEWNFGGGRNGEDGRERDPNIVDLMTLNGFELNDPETRKPAGRTQEGQMDFLTPEARARFARSADQVASVQLEATEFFDIEPPTVSLVGALTSRAVVPNAVLQDGPVVVRANIADDSGIEDARMYWWAPGETPAARRLVQMGKLRGDLDAASNEFAGDIPWEDVAEATEDGQLTDPEDLADRLRYIYVAIEATDIAGNSTVPADGTEADRFAAPYVIELPVEATTMIRYPDLLSGSDATIRIDLNEGSLFTIDRSVLVAAVGDSTAQVDLILRTIPLSRIDEAFRSSDNETVLGPSNRFLGIARRLELEVIDGGSTTTLLELPEPAQISFHFPRYLQRDEKPGELTLFRLEEIGVDTERWILVSGHGEADGSTITIRNRRLGSFAGFTTPVEIDGDRYVTGLVLTPNPFTPNGDGLYDEVDISYVLPEATNWAVVEVYDIRGEKVRVLKKFTPDDVTNRTLSITWDGRDEGGRLVPMGLYVVRVEVQSRSEGRVERATRAVAVVR